MVYPSLNGITTDVYIVSQYNLVSNEVIYLFLDIYATPRRLIMMENIQHEITFRFVVEKHQYN